jgi:hypothetical protein
MVCSSHTETPLRRARYAARPRSDGCSHSVVRSQPKTEACVDGMDSARVLIAWFGSCRLVAPEIKEQ